MGIQARRSSNDLRVDSPQGSTSKSDHSLGITSKPNQAAIASKSYASNIHIPSNSHSDQNDNASLMIEDAPKDSSFGDIDISFDMEVLEGTIKMYN